MFVFMNNLSLCIKIQHSVLRLHPSHTIYIISPKEAHFLSSFSFVHYTCVYFRIFHLCFHIHGALNITLVYQYNTSLPLMLSQRAHCSHHLNNTPMQYHFPVFVAMLCLKFSFILGLYLIYCPNCVFLYCHPASFSAFQPWMLTSDGSGELFVDISWLI